MWTAAAPLPVSLDQRRTLETWSKAHNTPKIVGVRADIVLLAADGLSNNAIANQLGITRVSVIEWRKRFAEEGLESLGKVRKGRGRPRTIAQETVAEIIHLTLNTKPEGGATHWSCRTMAKKVDVSPASIQRVWSEHRIYPHRIRTFKVSRDPRFVERLTDVVGLYMNPPDKAAVLCVDEKTMIQALDRTQPGLPIKPGKAGTMTHDYKRNGTVSLYAALNVLDGEVVGQCTARHRHQEFLRFLRQLDREFPKSLDLHIVLDNSSTHSHPNVRAWLDARPRFHLHFVPTSSSWLNMVEGVFADLTKRRLKRGSFPSVDNLTNAILDYLDHRNEDPKPFIWSASADTILAKLRDCKAVIETFH
jgi:transposase